MNRPYGTLIEQLLCQWVKTHWHKTNSSLRLCNNFVRGRVFTSVVGVCTSVVTFSYTGCHAEP